MKKVTLIVTACDRNDLLERTLTSFIKYNTYPIEKMVIRDDSGLKEVYKEMVNLLIEMNTPFPLEIHPTEQKGQARSIDFLMSRVETPYVFHCEEDWEFYRPDFIQKSMEILEENDKISHVWIRPPEGMNHPVWMSDQYHTIKNNYPYRLVKRSNHTNAWSFNPHLARMKDYIKPYTKIIKEAKFGEDAIGKFYKKLGFETAWLIEGYCKHIGEAKSTYRPGTPYREKAKKI